MSARAGDRDDDLFAALHRHTRGLAPGARSTPFTVGGEWFAAELVQRDAPDENVESATSLARVRRAWAAAEFTAEFSRRIAAVAVETRPGIAEVPLPFLAPN